VNARIPSYRLHKASGQAVVTLGGKDYYLGKHGTKESHAEYRRLTGLYVGNGFRLPTDPACGVTVAEMLVRFWEHASRYYRKRGKGTSQLGMIRVICQRLRENHGSSLALAFGPGDLKAIRESWIHDGNARETVNRKTRIVRQIFDWAVAEEMISGSVTHALRSVRGLLTDRTPAPDFAPVAPVPSVDLNATLAILTFSRAAMVWLQLLTGMRPGEVCSLRGYDINRDSPIWLYTPSSHKAEHHKRKRTIPQGPRAQAILGPLLDVADAERYLFHPRGSYGSRPLTTLQYWRAIQTACKRAGVTPWHPNQLRHNAATEIRRQFGLDAAQVILGHSRADVTQIYAEADTERMAEIAARIG
jgi:integrase